MLLRVFLVGAVAGLGLDLPSGRDVDRWFERSQTWLDQSWSCWSITGDETVCPAEDAVEDSPTIPESPSVPEERVEAVAATAPITTEPTDPPDSTDESFREILREMAAAFGRSTEPAVVEPPPGIAAPIAPPAFEPVVVGDDLYPGLAYELNRANEGAPIAEDSPSSAVMRDLMALEDPSESDPRPISTRGERLAVAVRLTEQALRAWVSLLRQGPSIISARE